MKNSETFARQWKLAAHGAALPGKVISPYVVPLDPAYKAGVAGHVPAKNYFAFTTLVA